MGFQIESAKRKGLIQFLERSDIKASTDMFISLVHMVVSLVTVTSYKSPSQDQVVKVRRWLSFPNRAEERTHGQIPS